MYVILQNNYDIVKEAFTQATATYASISTPLMPSKIDLWKQVEGRIYGMGFRAPAYDTTFTYNVDNTKAIIRK